MGQSTRNVVVHLPTMIATTATTNSTNSFTVVDVWIWIWI